MSTYLIYAIAAILAAFLLFITLRLHRHDSKGAVTALVSLPLCVLLGFAFAKLFYVIYAFLKDIGYFIEWGAWDELAEDSLLNLKPKTFCFTGGAVGVWLGVRLSAKLTGNKPAASVLDAFTVPGALLIAGLRMAEVELGTLGTGRFIETPEGSSYLILAVFNQYGEAHTAVFVLEAIAAAAVALWSVADKNAPAGQRFRNAVFRLCLCQILLENMRSQCMKWGFVRVEQLICAVILMILTLAACIRTKKKPAVRFLPAGAMFLCIAAIVGTEFLRQRSPSYFMGTYGGYLMMGAILLVMLLIYSRLVRQSASSSSGKESSKG